MSYLIFRDHRGYYGDEPNLEQHLKMCQLFNATPDFWDCAKNIEDLCEKINKTPENVIIVDATTYEILE